MTPSRQEIEQHVAAAVKEFSRSKPNCTGTFIGMTRRFERVPGCTREMALRLARIHFPGSAQAYDAAVREGRVLEIAPTAETFLQRAERAARNGGRLN